MTDGSSPHATMSVEGKVSAMKPIMFGPKWMYAQFGVVGFLIVMGCVNMVTQWKDRQILREEAAITRKEANDREVLLRSEIRDRDIVYRESLSKLVDFSNTRTENILKTQTELAQQIANLTKAIEILDKKITTIPSVAAQPPKPNDGG